MLLCPLAEEQTNLNWMHYAGTGNPVFLSGGLWLKLFTLS